MPETTQSPPAERLLTLPELAAELGVPRSTIFRWRRLGDGPVGIRLGRTLRFRRSDVDAWLDRHVETFRAKDGGSE